LSSINKVVVHNENFGGKTKLYLLSLTLRNRHASLLRTRIHTLGTFERSSFVCVKLLYLNHHSFSNA